MRDVSERYKNVRKLVSFTTPLLTLFCILTQGKLIVKMLLKYAWVRAR